MEIDESRIGYVCIPRLALAKRIFILWLFEFASCLVGSGLFLIFSVFCMLMVLWLSLKFLPVWQLFYKAASLYIVLLLSFVPAFVLGKVIREAVLWLIML